jgi:indole-3-glycerol phosphate synthase
MDWHRLNGARPLAPAVTRAELRPSIRDFTQYLGVGRATLGVIPLLLRRDPRRGVSVTMDDLTACARAFDELEVPALAVATEPEALAGCLDDLAAVAATVAAPVLRYDCVADEERLYESRLAGADAVLVPLAVAGDALAHLVALARAIHVVVLAEVATRAECALALAAGAPVIALATGALALAADIPARWPVIAQEDVAEPAGLARLRGHADAILVGGALFSGPDPSARARAFVDAAAALSA